MEVTRQLLTERPGKTGLCRIQLTFCWEGQRLRLSSGQKAHPRDWDARREKVKAKPGSYADAVNQVLDDYADVAQALHHEAAARGQGLGSPAALRPALAQGYARLVAERSGRAPVPPPPGPAELGFFDHYARWVEEERQKISGRTGRPLSPATLWTHVAVGRELQAAAAHISWR